MNQVQLVGRITQDLVMRQNSNGNNYVGFTVAINEYRGGKEYTTFVPCYAFEKTAENMVKFIGKGSQVALTGRLSVRQQNNNGVITTITSVNADRVEFLDNRRVSSNKTSQQPASSNNDYVRNDSNIDMDAINGFENNNQSNDSQNDNNDMFKDDDSILWD